MGRAEALLGTSLESRYRLDAVVTESPDLFVFSGEDTQGTPNGSSLPIVIRMPRAPRGMSIQEIDEAYAKFATEATQLAAISRASPHVERLLASGEVETPDRERLAFCVFERTEGSSLAESSRDRGAMPLPAAVKLLVPIASALATAHAQGVFHGDVRPENIVVVRGLDAERPALKLLRFTLATRLATGARAFSPQYGAPEHFKKSFGESSLGPPADVYGLALCLIELVTGQPALTGTSTTELYKQTTDITRRPTLRARGAEVSEAIDLVVARALAVNPKLRWPTAKDFWAALTALTGLGALTEPTAIPITPLPLPIATPAPASEPLPDEAPSARSSRLSITTEPTPAIPPPPGSQPNVVAPPPPPTRVPMSLAPSSTPAPSSSKPKRLANDAARSHEPAVLRRLDEGAVESHPPRGSLRDPRARAIAIAAASLATLAIGATLIASVFRRSTPAEPAAPSSAVATASATPAPPSASSSSAAPVASAAAPPGMVLVPAGTFTMGKDTEGKGDRPAHRVKITHAYYIDRLEVSVEAYAACIDAGACTARIVHLKKNASGLWGCNVEKDRTSHPANCIDRKQAAAYCAFVKKRLPTEAEWEYAARGDDERDFPWGNTAPASCAFAVVSGMTGGCGDRKGTSAAGTTTEGKSPFGALDMGGNVWEWVADDYAPYPADEVTDPMVTLTATEDSAPRGVLRGGSWDYGPQAAKTTYRLPFVTEAGNASIGVRCALSLP